MNYFSSTTLNPLFSEEKIIAKKQLLDEAKKQQEIYREKLDKATAEEIDKIKKLSGDKVKPSADFKIVILEWCTGIVRTKNILKNYEKMIESNIAILNGKTINEIEHQFYDNEKEEDPTEDDEDVKRCFESWLKNKTKQINRKSV